MSTKAIRRGKCHMCGCTENRACVVNGVPCHWANAAMTLCSACVKEAPPITSPKKQGGSHAEK